MFNRAIVAMDISPAQAALVSCLHDLIRWGIESVVLVHVTRIGYGTGAGYAHDDEYRAWLEEVAQPLRQSGLTVEVCVEHSGDVAGTLLQVARRETADLMVVGSRSHSIIRDLFLGSVARAVIRKADLPVLIERLDICGAVGEEVCEASCRNTLHRVLLATDHSARSSTAEEAAIALAPRAGSVACLHVLPADARAGEMPQPGDVEQHLQKLVERIEQAGGRGSLRVERGTAKDVISQVAREGFTLIVMGKHGQGWVEGAVIGSTAARVCEASDRSVLMVPVKEIS